MKNFTLIFLISFIIQSCENNQTKETKANRINNFQTLCSYFENPPSIYSTAPFWVWNDAITKEKIDTQLRAFKDQKINSLIIHCRPGLITEYLSDEWFELNRYALEQAKRMKIKLWLYDENGFPSGFGGGHVYREMPESFTQPQGLALQKLQKLDKTKIPESAIVLVKQGEKFKNITGNPEEYYQKTGDFYLFEKTFGPAKGRWTGYPYPDLLIPGVTERFIEITMNGYEETFGNEFGNNILGLFTDEPHVQPPSKSSIRWTPGLFQAFESRWAYSLVDKLPLLYEETGNYRKVRHDYYQLLIEIFVERWSKPWYNYTETHNLDWTGHYWEHGWPNPRHASDHMILYAYHQVPGIDMLFNDQKDHPDQFGNIMAVRELRSIANQFDRHRTLSETYGASGWDLDFESMKRLGDWEYAGGVNLMNQHLAYMTTKGARKRDFPQSISWHASWWSHYHHLTTHYARLSLAMSSGYNINDILVINPTTTTWMYFSPEQDKDYLGSSGITKSYANDFKEFIETMEKQKIEYDITSEMVIQEFGKVENDKFVIENRKYKKVILGPHVENLNQKTFLLLKSYLENGGQLYYREKLPEFLEAKPSNETKMLTESYPGQVTKIDSNPEQLQNHFTNHEFQLKHASLPEQLVHHRRIFEDGQLIFMTNFSEEDINKVSYVANGKSVSYLNTLNGNIEPYYYEKEGEQLKVTFQLHPGESLLLFFHKKSRNEKPAEIIDIQFNRKLTGSELQISRNKENVLVLDYCDLKVAGKSFKNINYLHAADSIFKFHGFKISDIDHNPWNFAVQYKTETLDRNSKFSSESGFEASFPFVIHEDFDMKPLKFGIEYGHLYTIHLNDKEIKPDKTISYFDHSIDIYPVQAKELRKGQNIIQLSIQPMHIHAELERIFIVGDFAAIPVKDGFEIRNPFAIQHGNWVKQGLPFYHESVSYSKKYTFDQELKPVKLTLNDWQGAVASVKVNGTKAGIIGWQPYELVLDDYLTRGENHIEVIIYGTPRNLLGPHYNIPPKGIATPWSWNNAPFSQPPGYKYSFLPYGLMEEFDVLTTD